MAPSTVKSIDDIPGWFPLLDQRVFEHLLGPDAAVPRGDLVELGVYMGKSAAFLGRFLAAGETLTVCDLFGQESSDVANHVENQKSYPTLDREKFEQNYLALHERLPRIVQGPSSVILDHVEAGSARLVHIDASHLYDHIVVDLASARTMVMPEGVVVFDDFRSAHTPGVSAAVWTQVGNGVLRPICLTAQKLYGTFGDPAPHFERLRAWADAADGIQTATDVIAGTTVLRLRTPPTQNTPTPDVPAMLTTLSKRMASIDRRLAKLESHGAQIESLEKAARAILKPEPDFATKVVRRLRISRRH